MSAGIPDIGFVSDEIDRDFVVASSLAEGWGVRLFELRALRSGRVPHVEAREMRAVLEIALSEDLRITALSPGIFKRSLDAAAAAEDDLENTLPRTIEWAVRFGAPTVIAFGFPDDAHADAARAADLLARAADRAAEAGLVLAIENEAGFLCDSGSRTAELLRRAAHPALKANWDPANAWGCGEDPFPDGYAAVRPWIANVHVKDTVEGVARGCVPVGEGRVDWTGQLAALHADAGVGHVTIETHCEPLAEMARRSLVRVREILRSIAGHATAQDDRPADA
jgi:sugar phosphate isomerase/epimerase